MAKQKPPRKIRFIRYLKAYLTKREKKLLPFVPQENPLHLVDLALKASLKSGKSYREALKWALENNDVLNIALTGPYGSGKSSILKTFEKTNPEYQYMKISLASFKDEIAEGDEKEGETVSEKNIKEPGETTIGIGNSQKGTIANGRIPKLESISKEKTKQEQHRLIELSIKRNPNKFPLANLYVISFPPFKYSRPGRTRWDMHHESSVSSGRVKFHV